MLPRPLLLLLVLLGLLYAGIGVMGGLGTDGDLYAMLRSGIDVLRGEGYFPSRTPGYPLPEIAAAGAALIGGAVAANLLSAILACVALACFFNLLREPFGKRAALAATAAAGVNPYWILAATVSMDYVYAAAFCLAGFTALRANRPVFAAVLLAASMASRLTFLPLCLLGAAGIGFYGRREISMRRWLGAAASCAALGIVAYVPSWKALGAGMFTVTVGTARVPFFGENGFQSWIAVAGRFGYKNVFLWGIPAFVVLCAAIPGMIRAWRAGSPGTRMSLAMLAVALGYVELMFWRLPLEAFYLLPVVFIATAALAFTRHRAVLLPLLIAAQAVQTLVSFDLIEVRYATRRLGTVEASGAEFHPGLKPGPLVEDLRLRPEAQAYFLPQYGLQDLR